MITHPTFVFDNKGIVLLTNQLEEVEDYLLGSTKK